MITIKSSEGNLIEVTISGPLKAEDFKDFAAKADALIKEHGSVRLLIDASDFEGWEDVAAAEQHFSFVKGHHNNVEKLAFVVGHMWQHWLAGMAKVFVHPQIKAFDKNQIEEARNWLTAANGDKK